MMSHAHKLWKMLLAILPRMVFVEIVFDFIFGVRNAVFLK